MKLSDIDISFDVQSDSNGKDPDSASPTLKAYHQLLWSKPLPDGRILELTSGKGYYLRWNDMYFGSDSITASFLHARYPLRQFIEENIPNFKEFKREYWHRTYTIGGAIIFPQVRWSMNQARGCHPKICDRWDFTLECIRRFYAGESSPLDTALQRSGDFFRLFGSFKEYVDFFLLQDCVDDDYKVKIWLDTPVFESHPMPKSLEEYYKWIQTQLDFVDKRGKRIKEYCNSKGD